MNNYINWTMKTKVLKKLNNVYKGNFLKYKDDFDEQNYWRIMEYRRRKQHEGSTSLVDAVNKDLEQRDQQRREQKNDQKRRDEQLVKASTELERNQIAYENALKKARQGDLKDGLLEQIRHKLDTFDEDNNKGGTGLGVSDLQFHSVNFDQRPFIERRKGRKEQQEHMAQEAERERIESMQK